MTIYEHMPLEYGGPDLLDLRDVYICQIPFAL